MPFRSPGTVTLHTPCPAGCRGWLPKLRAPGSASVPVAYSLGNFWFNSKTLDTGMIKVTLNENGLQSCQFIPCLQSGSRTVLLQGEEKQRVLDFMRDISDGVQIDEDGYVTW